jgi:hypothetical protein
MWTVAVAGLWLDCGWTVAGLWHSGAHPVEFGGVVEPGLDLLHQISLAKRCLIVHHRLQPGVDMLPAVGFPSDQSYLDFVPAVKRIECQEWLRSPHDRTGGHRRSQGRFPLS